MKKGFFAGSLISCAVAAVMIFSSAGLSQPKAHDFKWPPMLRIAQPTTQGTSFASTNGRASILLDTGANVRGALEPSEVRRMLRFDVNKEFELNSVSNAKIPPAFEGTDGYKVQRAAPVVLTWFQNGTLRGFAGRGDSEFDTVYDHKKSCVRVVVSAQPPSHDDRNPAGPACLYRLDPAEGRGQLDLGACGKLYPDNYRTIPDGQADVAYMTLISGITFEMKAHPLGLHWLSMPIENVEGWNRFMDIPHTVLPVKADFGVKSAHDRAMLASAFLYTTTPDRVAEMIYRLAKWFHETFDSYKGVHTVAPRMSIERFRTFLNNSPLTIAEGTVRYLREIGMWTEVDDQWNKEAHELMNRWIAARNAAIDETEANRVRLHCEDEDCLKIFDKQNKGIPVSRTRLH